MTTLRFFAINLLAVPFFISSMEGQKVDDNATRTKEEIYCGVILVHNQSTLPIVARLKGFGALRTGNKNQEYILDTVTVIESGQIEQLHTPTSIGRRPISSIYEYYASALVVRVKNNEHFEKFGDINTEAHFTSPFEYDGRSPFIVTGHSPKPGHIKLQIQQNAKRLTTPLLK
jgi:hypothetical protein